MWGTLEGQVLYPGPLVPAKSLLSFREHPLETVRKAPVGPGPEAQKATKGAQKPYFAALGTQNGGLRGSTLDPFRTVSTGNPVI